MDTHLQLLSRYHRHGDADAFSALVKDHAGMVFATAKRVTGDAILAEDVAQETFVELARSGHGVVQSVAAWLHRVAWRKACNTIRGESRRRHHEQTAADIQQDGPEATWDELKLEIDEVLMELPEALREPLVQHYLEGRTQQELAARMGVNQSTVSRQLEVALRELRARLRIRGVICGAGLASLLSAHTSQAAPVSLTVSLGKLAISGAGSSITTASPVFIASTLTAMTATTKVLFVTIVVGAITIPLVLQEWSTRGPEPVPKKLLPKPNAVAKEVASSKIQTNAGEHHYRPAPVSRQTQQTVDDILRRHKGLTKEQLQNSAELNGLMDRFIGVISEPSTQTEIARRIAELPAKGKHGTVTMDYDMLDNATGRAWLEAVVANDRNLMHDWVLNTLDGAVFEFALDPDMERTSNGVKLQSATTKKPAAPAPPDE